MKAQGHSGFIRVLCIFCILFSASSFGLIDGKNLTIGDSTGQGGAPYFYATLDAAGFSDWIFYGQSPIHSYGYHELLSGEWGAAIYYDGIDTAIIDPNTGDCQAMWLTQQFEYPYWSTNSHFSASGFVWPGIIPTILFRITIPGNPLSPTGMWKSRSIMRSWILNCLGIHIPP